MRVLTAFGLGELLENEELNITVVLDGPFREESSLVLKREEVFLFSDWAVVKVINISGLGTVSNLQFHESREKAEAILDLPMPPDETALFLDLKEGRFKANHRLGPMLQESFIIKPWVDRWAREDTEMFKYILDARKRFEDIKKNTARTSGGIEAFVRLDSEFGGNILGFFLLVPSPQGVIFERMFRMKVHEG